MFQIFAEYIGALGLASRRLDKVYATREEALAVATAMNCKCFTPFYFSVVSK